MRRTAAPTAARCFTGTSTMTPPLLQGPCLVPLPLGIGVGLAGLYLPVFPFKPHLKSSELKKNRWWLVWQVALALVWLLGRRGGGHGHRPRGHQPPGATVPPATSHRPSHQPPATSHQWAVRSAQWAVGSGQWLAVGRCRWQWELAVAVAGGQAAGQQPAAAASSQQPAASSCRCRGAGCRVPGGGWCVAWCW
jgi:hypothetical protein